MPTSSSPTSFDVHYGIGIHRPQPIARVERLMSRNPNSLGNRIRRGEVRSAWDDYDSEADAIAGRKSSPETLASATEIREQFEKQRREREEADRRHEEAVRKAREEEERRRAEEAQRQLEALDGFGSF